MSKIEVNESLLGKNLRGIKGFDCSSHYAHGEFAVAAKGLSLLRNVVNRIHFWQIFANAVMGGSPCCKFSNKIRTFHLQSMFVMWIW